MSDRPYLGTAAIALTAMVTGVIEYWGGGMVAGFIALIDQDCSRLVHVVDRQLAAPRHRVRTFYADD
jgi:hypothetical protein